MEAIASLGTEIWILMHGPLGFAIGIGGLFIIARNATLSLLEMGGATDFLDESKHSNELPNEKRKLREIHTSIRNHTLILIGLFSAAVCLYISIYTSIDSDAVRNREVQLNCKQTFTTLCIFVLAVLAVFVEALIARQKLKRNILFMVLKR